MPTKKFISSYSPLILLAVLILAAGIFWYRSNRQNNQIVAAETEDFQPQSARVKQTAQSLADIQSGKKRSFVHPVLEFTFDYPEGFSVGDIPEGDDGETLLVQKGNTGFQIFISPIQENVDMTAEKIKADIPDMQVSNPISLNLDGTKALAFDSQNDGGINTREIWFSRNKKLYQISAFREFTPALGKIMETWKWKK